MTAGRLLLALLALWLAAAVLYQIGSIAALRSLLRRSPSSRRPPARPTRSRPSAVILRPLFGAPPGLRRALESACALGVPVIAGVEDAADPAATIARDLAARLPPGRLTLVEGAAPRGANRKVANLLRMLPAAPAEVIVFSDADVVLPEGYLDAILAPFEDPGVGVVTCPYRNVAGRSIGARLDAILTNAGFLPSVALAERLEGVRFALGATVAIRRRLLESIGGLAPLLDVLADDYALADRARRAGARVVLAPLLLDHHVDDPLEEVFSRHLRWARTMRAVRPAGFAGTILTHGTIPSLLVAGLVGPSLGLAVAAGWFLVRVGGLALLARRLGLTLLDLALVFPADLLAFLVYLGGLTGRTVAWGGRRLVVRRDGSVRDQEADELLPSDPAAG